MTAWRCAHCGTDRPESDLLAVVEIRTGRRRYVCRPSSGSACFSRNVRTADIDRIEATP